MKKLFSFLSLIIILCIVSRTLASISATLLPVYEVEALKQIARTLGKEDRWDFSEDPCSGKSGWVDQTAYKAFRDAVSCDCSFSNNTVCHVTSIVLKGQNLPGVLPKELVRLPYLQEIDLTRNYLSGTLPQEWGSMKLVTISLLGNRLTGSIPKEFGNISTLENLIIEQNQLSGVIPPELGNLSRIQHLYLNSNNFTGELPETLAKLTTLTDFRIGDNLFKGKIPDFIQEWTRLEKLIIRASGLEGPIPSGIALLTNLTDLRISDLYGPEATFPPLRNMKRLQNLILRSCNIIRELPGYLEEITNLTILDLSFNKLSGQIPSSSVYLNSTKYIYLTGNLLSGPVPDWMLEEGKQIDLSYNNLTFESSRERTCQSGMLNLFGSSSMSYASGIISCLRSSGFVCPKNWSSLYINCGGKELSVDGKTYLDDTEPGGPSKFWRSEANWAFSSTGHFLDNEKTDTYTSTNTMPLSLNTSALYKDARMSPLSLTYYGFCLVNGNYTVRLHFAEIVFADDKTFNSLGRRIFDVYIQGKLVLKDFNIANEAGGAGKEIVKRYTVLVTNNTLDIRFYWAGKGTTHIPSQSEYGPLISAISVDLNFGVPVEPGRLSQNRNRVSAGIVAGIVVGVAFSIFLVLGIFWWCGCLRCKDAMKLDLRGVELTTGSFTLRKIKAATNDFDATNKIGEGGFGAVYKGVLLDGTIIAVKQLSSKSKQGNREFMNEIGMISALQHPHLVKLHGCCIEENQLLLVYEYMENNSLARALFGPKEFQVELDWATRYKICIGIARGLAYLHEESRLKVVHRDIKATNVLLDKNLNPKISDFGLAKLDDGENTHINTRIAGTFGYMAPEYALRGYLTHKADVYSYGIVALEIVSGMANSVDSTKENHFILLDRALELKKGKLMELVDPRLGSEYDKEEVMIITNVALLCTNVSPADRPMMSSVVTMLEGRTLVQEPVSAESVSNCKTNSIRMENQQLHSQSTRSYDTLIESSWTGTMIPGSEFYRADIDSEYLEERDNELTCILCS